MSGSLKEKCFVQFPQNRERPGDSLWRIFEIWWCQRGAGWLSIVPTSPISCLPVWPDFPCILFASMTFGQAPGPAFVERSPWSACGQLNSKKCCWTLISSRNLSQCLVINIKHNFLTSNGNGNASDLSHEKNKCLYFQVEESVGVPGTTSVAWHLFPK